MSWRHCDLLGLCDILTLALLHSKRLADDGTVGRRRLKGRDSVPARSRFHVHRQDSEGSGTAALQEGADLFALSQKRLHWASRLDTVGQRAGL